jgi:transcription-repair coupling factor (superfamily II helicase)
VATKRLKSIQEFTELGSGYKIAQRDLMIRGAGDILGSEQAGFIDDVGIDLYLKLLNDAIARKEGKEVNRAVGMVSKSDLLEMVK